MNPFDFKYTHAVVSRVPSSLREATYTRRKDPLGIDLDKAVEQHNEYIGALRKLGIDVIELQADDTLPDSTFVDCMAVVCNGTALIARPHLVSRRKEVRHPSLQVDSNTIAENALIHKITSFLC